MARQTSGYVDSFSSSSGLDLRHDMHDMPVGVNDIVSELCGMVIKVILGTKDEYMIEQHGLALHSTVQ